MRKQIATVSIIIPVFNEQNTIEKVINLVKRSNTSGLPKEIIVVDDGSTDQTGRILKKLKQSKNFKIYFNNINVGKGYSLKKGIQASKGDIVIVQDADLEYSPSNYTSLIRPIMDGYADVVYGSRFINSGPQRVLFYYHYIGNKLITALSNLLTNLNMTDIETGHKVFKGAIIRKIAPNLISNRFGFEPEVTAKLSKIKNIRIYEVGISYFGRTYEEGKKIGWFDGILAIIQIIRFNIFN